VNRLKQIKRMMYGTVGFELLRARVLNAGRRPEPADVEQSHWYTTTHFAGEPFFERRSHLRAWLRHYLRWYLYTLSHRSKRRSRA
jgi:hypothetical protein